MIALLKPDQVASTSQISARTARRRMGDGSVRAVWVGSVRRVLPTGRTPADVLEGAPAVLAPHQVAELLAVHLNTVYRLAARGKLPGYRKGGGWAFRRQALQGWLERDDA
jgi:excisionase family DNA binding protein